jgi:hypothetical protein
MGARLELAGAGGRGGGGDSGGSVWARGGGSILG